MERQQSRMRRGVLTQYGRLLPVTDNTPQLSMGEGNTPLVRAGRLQSELGSGEIWLKCEGLNPTGSFKDRGMVLAVAKAVEGGAKRVMCASTGNTAASASAYAARAGVECLVLAPQGGVALAKLGQARVHGARIMVIDGNFDQGLDLVRRIAQRHDVAIVNSVNPDRIAGQMTAAWEVCDDLRRAPSHLFVPVGNAGNITAYWRGFKRYREEGMISDLPKMMGFQAEGAAPIVRDSPVPNPVTKASAIRIGNPASWQGAVTARQESHGDIGWVSDDEMLEAQEMLAKLEGVYCELASAASVAGLVKLARASRLSDGACAVCVLTGHGLKESADRVVDGSLDLHCPGHLEEIEACLGWPRP